MSGIDEGKLDKPKGEACILLYFNIKGKRDIKLFFNLLLID